MISRYLNIPLLIICALIIIPGIARAQCNAIDITENCITQLDSSFHFLKSYSLDGQEGDNSTIEHSYVLTRSTDYMIKLCSEAESEMDIVIDIFDSNRRNVASNKSDSIISNFLEFDCRVTGIYYLQYSFVNSEDYCGGSAIGFKSE